MLRTRAAYLHYVRANAHANGVGLAVLAFSVRAGDSAADKSGLVFTDPVGITRIAVIAVGRYSAATLASFLQQEMNKNSHEDQTFVFSVEFVEAAGDTGSFVFRCSSRDDSSVGMPFSIRFAHPRSIAAERLGFEQMTLEGLDVYESENIHIPRVAMFDKTISNNTYAISEVHGQAFSYTRHVTSCDIMPRCVV